MPYPARDSGLALSCEKLVSYQISIKEPKIINIPHISKHCYITATLD